MECRAPLRHLNTPPPKKLSPLSGGFLVGVSPNQAPACDPQGRSSPQVRDTRFNSWKLHGDQPHVSSDGQLFMGLTSSDCDLPPLTRGAGDSIWILLPTNHDLHVWALALHPRPKHKPLWSRQGRQLFLPWHVAQRDKYVWWVCLAAKEHPEIWCLLHLCVS